jgi:glutaredoxin 3
MQGTFRMDADARRAIRPRADRTRDGFAGGAAAQTCRLKLAGATLSRQNNEPRSEKLLRSSPTRYAMYTATCLLLLGAAHAIQLGASPRGQGAQSAPAVSEISQTPVSLDVLSEIQQTVSGQAVVVFSKSGCAHSLECKGLFDAIEQPYVAFELDQRSDGEAIEAALLSLTQDRPLPHVFVRGQLLGGSAEMQEAAATGLLYELLEESVLPPKGCVVPTRGKGPK